MSQGTPSVLSPPIASTVEEEPILFDFGPLLNSYYVSNISISAVDEINITAVAGDDTSAQSRLIVPGSIVPSREVPSIQSGAVVCWVGSMVGGVTYLLQCVVSLSDGNSHPSIEVKLSCYTPGA